MSEWKLVPVEPTQEMETNAWTDSDCRREPLSCKRIYKAMLAAAPTPEVEPVAYRKFNPRWGDYTYVSNPYPNASCEPLYTHPDQSELVKAARELIDAYDRALPFRPDNLDALMCNLDAALDKVKP